MVATLDEPIAIEFDNTLTGHLAAERLYYSATFWAKGDKVVAVLLVVGAGVLLAAGGPSWTALLFVAAIAEWFNLLSPWRARAWYFFKRNPKFLETYRLTFSDSGIHFKTASIDSNIAWTHYNRVLEDERVMLLIYGPRMYTVIPKRVFADSAQLEAFRELVGRKIERR
jgi:hypothetical protein